MRPRRSPTRRVENPLSEQAARITTPEDPSFVVASELEVPASGVAALERAFRNRLGEVEKHPGFQRLEVWRDHQRPGAYLMVTWWENETDFRAYMRSTAHRTSHARIPTDPVKARGVGLRRFTRIAT